ncbi:MAG: hypothetical protein FJ284_13790 [Planctomycetes bacterium]|nr:hypothetical protein [Planctomycetota bacterium]
MNVFFSPSFQLPSQRLTGLSPTLEERLSASKSEGIPIDRARLWEIDRVEDALRIQVGTGIFRASQHGTATADLTGVLAGLVRNGVDQFEVTHNRTSPRKGNGTRNTPASQKGRRDD